MAMRSMSVPVRRYVIGSVIWPSGSTRLNVMLSAVTRQSLSNRPLPLRSSPASSRRFPFVSSPTMLADFSSSTTWRPRSESFSSASVHASVLFEVPVATRDLKPSSNSTATERPITIWRSVKPPVRAWVSRREVIRCSPRAGIARQATPGQPNTPRHCDVGLVKIGRTARPLKGYLVGEIILRRRGEIRGSAPCHRRRRR
jgi:hypothetical protein